MTDISFCYQITDRISDAISQKRRMTVKNLENYKHFMNVTELKPLSPKDQKDLTKAFMKIMSARGIPMINQLDPFTGSPVPVIVFTEENKQLYFSKKFENMKQIVSGMDLRTFACTPMTAFYRELCDGWDDYVYLSKPVPMDYFVRSAETNHPYYLGSIVRLDRNIVKKE